MTHDHKLVLFGFKFCLILTPYFTTVSTIPGIIEDSGSFQLPLFLRKFNYGSSKLFLAACDFPLPFLKKTLVIFSKAKAEQNLF